MWFQYGRVEDFAVSANPDSIVRIDWHLVIGISQRWISIQRNPSGHALFLALGK